MFKILLKLNHLHFKEEKMNRLNKILLQLANIILNISMMKEKRKRAV
jgi:hypothetical protein